MNVGRNRFAHQGTAIFLVAAFLTASTLAAPAALAQGPAQGLAQGKELTVERIWGQPSLSGATTTGLQWSPDGKLLSYFQRTGRGREAVTDVWVLDVSTGQRRVLLDSAKLAEVLPPPREVPMTQAQQTGLGRLTPQRYAWAPNGKALLFVSQGSLYWFDLEKQTGKRLTTGDRPVVDPKISPNGLYVSFVRDHDLWVVEVASGRERRLTQGGSETLLNGELDWVYPEELSIRTAYWWAPDSSRIAYLQMNQSQVTRYPLVDLLSYTGATTWMRYPKAGDANPIVRVGVVGARGGSTRWMDIGTETEIYIPRVEWLRDSRRLAIQRLNREQDKLDLLFADAANGRSRVILTEEAKAWINVHDDLHFLADGRHFLWSSERDGFRHLYLYDLDGKQIRRLTAGNWGVSSVQGVDESTRSVYFIATEKSPLERHLCRTSLDNGVASRITAEEGTHSINLAPGAKHYVDTFSDNLTPPRQALHRIDGARVHVINENRVAELAEYNLQAPQFLTVRGGDGTELHAMMIRPPDFNASRKYPVLVHLYGGPHGQSVRRSWGGNNFLWHQMMAQKGYIIFILDNRGMAARGHAFEAHLHRRMGEIELQDQLKGVEYLRSQPYVDGARIGIWGWSYGGYMTLYAMTNAPEVYKAGFAGAPVTDWRQYDTIYTERYMDHPRDNEEGYKNSSPVTHVAKLQGKLLIAHGTGDDNVHYANTVEFVEQLIRAGKYAEVMLYPRRGHGISDSTARIHLFHRVTQFFLDNL